MEKLKYECKEYKLYSPDSLDYITNNMHKILLSKIKEYKDLFNINEYRQIQINFFDNIDKFKEYIYSISGDTLPDYATSTYHNKMINAYIPNNLKTGTLAYQDRLYIANHDLFHIMYEEIILKGDTSKRIVWYDEGMAQFVSGEKFDLDSKENFKDFYLSVKENTKLIPNLNDINHENNFCNELYNGYDLSYLSIRYLSETLNEEDFKNLLNDFNKIKEYGKTILNEMFQYYDNKLSNKQR